MTRRARDLSLPAGLPSGCWQQCKLCGGDGLAGGLFRFLNQQAQADQL